jgi:hypothetical protein
MTDQPYTDEDLRAEAAHQHRILAADPDFMGIGEMMDGSEIDSTGTTWDQLGDGEFDAAQRAIDDLLGKAADVSDWAINLGADGLEPDEEHVDIAGARIHFAFDPSMPEEMRASVIAAVHAATAEGAQR